MTRKITLSEAQKLQLIGLQTVARHLTKQMDAIEAAAQEITGETKHGFTSDFLWSQTTVDDLCDALSGPSAEFVTQPDNAENPETQKEPRAGEPGGAST